MLPGLPRFHFSSIFRFRVLLWTQREDQNRRGLGPRPSKHLSRLKTAYSTKNGALYKVSSTPKKRHKWPSLTGIILLCLPYPMPTMAFLQPATSATMCCHQTVTPTFLLAQNLPPEQIMPTDKVDDEHTQSLVDKGIRLSSQFVRFLWSKV